MHLPVPWLDAASPRDAADLNAMVEFVVDHPGADQHLDLVAALTQSAARARLMTSALGASAAVLCAQFMLELAVEWRMPAVERWAVAWLTAIGGTHFRLRWSSRARDGRFRREIRMPEPIVTVAATTDRAVIGLASGSVSEWVLAGELRPLLASTGQPVWALAAQGNWTVAAGPHNSFVTSGWSPGPPSLPAPVGGIRIAAISLAGDIVLGDEPGRLLAWAPGGDWVALPTVLGSPTKAHAGGAGQAVAVAYARLPGRVVRAVWSLGEITEFEMGADARGWRTLHRLGADVRAAAWSQDGTLLAVAVAGQVRLVSPGEDGAVTVRTLWSQEGAQALAWSATGILASASLDQIHVSTAPVSAAAAVTAYKSITSDEKIDAIAVLGDEQVIAVRDRQVVQWELGGVGSDDPTFHARDPITAIAVAQGNRLVAMVGTERGRLQQSDATGMLGESTRVPRSPRIKQVAWFAKEKAWLVASVDGLYKYRPDDRSVTELASGKFSHVAASSDRFAYARKNRITTSEARTFTLPGTITDLHFDPLAGTLAAIDECGNVVLHGPGADREVLPPKEPAATRLFGIRNHWLLIRRPGDCIRWTSHRGGGRTYRQLPGGESNAAVLSADQIVVTYRDQGIRLAGARQGDDSQVATGVAAVAAGAGRIVVATASHLAGYDVFDTADTQDGGSVVLRASSGARCLVVQLPSGETITLETDAVAGLRPEQPVGELSEAVFQAGRLGDLLWQGGLDLAIDQARGQDPYRAVRLSWRFAPDDRDADDFPWELMHPSQAPLGWFDDPAITVTRLVTPTAAGRGRRPLAGHSVSPSMLVLRGTGRGLEAVDDAFDRFRRRTRRADVRLVTAKPVMVGDLDALMAALTNPVDILQLWAHSDADGVELGAGRHNGVAETQTLADRIAALPPRLVVLVGCTSGTLGRALVERGVLAAVAMRVPVHDHTVQSLVEDFTAEVLAGTAVDLAFAGALRRYLLTGQPGAAAVPMLYLADDGDGVLFPPSAALEQPAITTWRTSA